MGDVIAGIDFRSGYAKKSWQHEVADERRKEADRLAAKSADTAPSEMPFGYCAPKSDPA